MIVAALERGPVIAVACDQPWVTAQLLDPARVDVAREQVARTNTPEDLAAAECRVTRAEPEQLDTRARRPA